MLYCPHHKGWNYFQAEGTKKELRINLTSNTFQRKYENFD